MKGAKSSFGNRALQAMAVLVSLSLIVAHAIKPKLKIDSVTLGLLAFGALPFIGEIVTSFKAGGVEFELRERINDEQIFPFLESIVSKHQWTFFAPRHGEAGLGLPFKILTRQLLDTVENKFAQRLRTWLRSQDLNQRWFAAEVIGYHRLTRLLIPVSKLVGKRGPNERLASWELNCHWAAARLSQNQATAFGALLSSTDHPDNVRWILKSFEQMLLEPDFLPFDDRRLLLEKVRAYVAAPGRAACLEGLGELAALTAASVPGADSDGSG